MAFLIFLFPPALQISKLPSLFFFSMSSSSSPQQSSYLYLIYTLNIDIWFQFKTYLIHLRVIPSLIRVVQSGCMAKIKRNSFFAQGNVNRQGKGGINNSDSLESVYQFLDYFLPFFIIIKLHFIGKKESFEGCWSEFIRQLDYSICQERRFFIHSHPQSRVSRFALLTWLRCLTACCLKYLHYCNLFI